MIYFSGAGQIGMVQDIPPQSADFGAWMELKNVQVLEGYIKKGDGSSSQLTAVVDPYGLFAIAGLGQTFYVYGGLTEVHAFQGTTQAEITRAASDYGGNEITPWILTVFNGIPILNNGVDAPQMWVPMSLSQKLVDLTNWPASMTAKVVRGYKNYLVALNISRTGLTDPQLVKWSHSADPRTVPTSWDHTDATKDAGEQQLAETDDKLIDCRTLGPVNVIYGEKSTTRMSFIGAPLIFDFKTAFPAMGLLAVDCVRTLRGKHIMVTFDDVVVHDTYNIESIISRRMRSWFFNNLNPSAYDKTRLVLQARNREAWILFPYQSSSVLNMALVWNWADNTWSLTELPNVLSVADILFRDSTGEPWSDFTGTWADTAESWNLGGTERSFVGSLMIGAADKSIGAFDATLTQRNGANFESTMTRTHLDVAKGFDGSLYHDPSMRRMIRSVWPIIEAPTGTVFSIDIGGQEEPYGSPTWAKTISWIKGQAKADVYHAARYPAIRFRSSSDANWRFFGYHLDIVPVGML